MILSLKKKSFNNLESRKDWGFVHSVLQVSKTSYWIHLVVCLSAMILWSKWEYIHCLSYVKSILPIWSALKQAKVTKYFICITLKKLVVESLFSVCQENIFQPVVFWQLDFYFKILLFLNKCLFSFPLVFANDVFERWITTAHGWIIVWGRKIRGFLFCLR